LVADLTDVIKRFKGRKLLEQILNPSIEIHKDFQTLVLLTYNREEILDLLAFLQQVDATE